MSRYLFIPVTLVAVFLAAEFAVGDEAQSDTTGNKGMVLFDKQIKPVLAKHCYECHSKNGEEIGAGLELDSRAGMDYGETDELGYKAVDGAVHLHDFHATMLHLLGLDHTKLVYRYGVSRSRTTLS